MVRRVPAGDFCRCLVGRCAGEGLRAPSGARLWPRLVRLGRMGLLLRQVRLGGPGGSSTMVRLVPRSDLTDTRPPRTVYENFRAEQGPPGTHPGRVTDSLKSHALVARAWSPIHRILREVRVETPEGGPEL